MKNSAGYARQIHDGDRSSAKPLQQGDIVMARTVDYFGGAGHHTGPCLVLGIEHDAAAGIDTGMWLLRFQSPLHAKPRAFDLEIDARRTAEMPNMQMPQLLRMTSLYLSSFDPGFENRRISRVSTDFMRDIFDRLKVIERLKAFEKLDQVLRGAHTVIMPMSGNATSKTLTIPGVAQMRRQAGGLSLVPPAPAVQKSPVASARAPTPQPAIELFREFRAASQPAGLGSETLEQALRDSEAAYEMGEYPEAQAYLIAALNAQIALTAMSWTALGILREAISHADASIGAEARQAALDDYARALGLQSDNAMAARGIGRLQNG